MDYLAINGVDFSAFVNTLKVATEANYNAQTNAAGNTVVDYINSKRIIEVGFIPMDNTELYNLFDNLPNIVATLTVLDPKTMGVTDVVCLCPADEIEYYTIQPTKVMYKPFTLTFTEL